jgi:exo-1,4-beta-D-glucosaminidase
MLNSSWPKLIWQLYGYDLLPNAALYGTKKALEPLQAIYDYGKNEIVVSNTSMADYHDLSLNFKVLNLDMKELISQNIPFEIKEDQHKVVYKLPNEIQGLNETYFLDLRIVNQDEEMLAINQYVLTQTVHEFDWEKTYFAHTPTKKHQNLQGINKLPRVQLKSNITSSTDQDKTNFVIEVENPSEQLALSVELMLLNNETGHFVAPVYLDDNYFSLLPGEKRTIKGYCFTSDLNGAAPKLKVSGININEQFTNQ